MNDLILSKIIRKFEKLPKTLREKAQVRKRKFESCSLSSTVALWGSVWPSIFTATSQVAQGTAPIHRCSHLLSFSLRHNDGALILRELN